MAMSFDDWYDKKYGKKKKKDEEIAPSVTKDAQPTIDETFDEWYAQKYGKLADEDIAPVRKQGTWFDKGAWDGSVRGAVNTILGTGEDILLGALQGVGKVVEGVVDLGAYGVSGVQKRLGNYEAAEKTKKWAQRGIVDKATQKLDDEASEWSVLGEKADSVTEGLGQIALMILTGGAASAGAGAAGAGAVGQGIAATTATTGLMGMSGMGSGMGEAYLSGSTDDEALAYGAMKGAVDAGSELIFGGLGKGVKALGLSRGIGGLDDIFAKNVSSKLSNAIFKNPTARTILANTIEGGIKAGGEGLEEVLAGYGSAIAKKLTYMDDKELSQLVEDENLLEQFVVGFLTSSISQAPSVIDSTAKGKDFVTDLTVDEQAVIDKVVENEVAKAKKDGKTLTKREKTELYDKVQNRLERGEIDTATIEELLGGKEYDAYKTAKERQETDLKELAERYEGEELKQKVESYLAESKLGEIQTQLTDATIKRINADTEKLLGKNKKGRTSFLAESYVQREKRGKAFTADLTQIEEKYQGTYKKAVESGILNDTRKTHDFVDLIAKISAEKGVSFDFTNNAKIAETGFAVEGKTVNGYVDGNTIGLNIDSHKALEKTVGHEISHVLEGTEFFEDFQKAAVEYAKSKKATNSKFKNEYDERMALAEALYQNVEGYQGADGMAKIRKEVTADLVGDYIFTDEAFLRKLSTDHKNVFKRMYDEIKYLCKVATAGSEQAKQLERVKHLFEKVYREGGNTSVESTNDTTNTEENNVTYSLVEDQETIDFLENQDYLVVYKAMSQIDGKLYPPMSSQEVVEETQTLKNGKTKTKTVRKLKNPSVLGKWQQSDERPDLIKSFKQPTKKYPDGYGQFDLLKSNGKSTNGVAYNPYEHTSNIVLNDQFSEAYQRPELVTVEYHIPVSELTSGYKAQYAKDPVGLTDWKAGTVATKLKNSRRDVYLTRWSKPVRVLDDAEVAAKYKEILDKEDGIAVPWNVVTPNLRAELEKIGVPIDYSDIKAGSTIRTFEAAMRGEYDAKSKKSGKVKYSLSEEKPFNINDYTLDELANLTDEQLDEAYKALGLDGYFESNEWEDIDEVFGGDVSIEDISEEINVEPEKIEILVRREGLGTSHIVENRTAVMTQERINRDIKDSGAGFHPDYAQKYITKISPKDFIDLTVLQKNIDRERFDAYVEGDSGNTMQSFNYENALRDSKQTPYLVIDRATGRVIGHNGRHRMRALEKVGIESVEIEVELHDENGAIIKYNSETIPEMAISSQFDTAIETRLSNIIPLNEAHRGEIGKSYGETAHANAGIRFSLSETVEETKDLVAVHNLTEEKLLKSLQLGGLPMPSIAIARAKEGHSQFGKISLVFGKDTIDPQSNRNNKVYSGDAWTPTYPTIEYKANENVAEKISGKYYELYKEIGDSAVRPMYRYMYDLDDVLNRYGGETALLERLYGDADMMQLYSKISNDNTADGYKFWVDNLFKGIEEKSGIRNNKDMFTPSGNRRSFEALHYEHNLENVIKAMKGNGDKGLGVFGRGNIFGAATTEYKSIADIKDAAETRMQNIPQEEYEAMREGFAERFYELANSLPIHKDSFTATDDAADMLIEAITKYNTKSGMANYLRTESKGWANYNDYVVDDLIQLVDEIRQMPTDYFEAKPQRAVGFDEVATAIIPDNASAELKQMLADNGVNFVEYESGNEQARLEVLNSLEDVRFSLSNQAETKQSNLTYGEDVKLDIAPIKETKLADDIAPMTEDEANALQDELFNSITDADAPPEVETYYDSMPDTSRIDDKALNNIGKTLRETLYLDAKQTKAIQEIVQEYSTNEMPSNEDLFTTIKQKFGEIVWRDKNTEIADVKRTLRNTKINVSQYVKAGIDDYSNFRKSHSGKIHFAKDGIGVDVAYQELSEMYPDFFPADIINPADQLLRMGEVADLEVYSQQSQQIDDATIQQAVDIISSEVSGYKNNLTRQAAEDTASEALYDIAPPRAEQLASGARGDALLNQSLDNYPIKTVEDKIAEKIRAVNEELNDNKVLRREAMQNYDNQIAELSQEYANLKNKNTKKANDIIRRVVRLEQLKASNDANYSKRISDLEARLEKMNSPKYNKAMHKKAKMQEYADFAKNLIGDTLHWVDKKLGLQYATNTEHRNLRDIVRDENGNKDIARADAINEELSGKYNQHEAELKRELTQIRKKYADLKITKAEDAYIQMLGELRGNPDTTLTEKVVNEYYEKHKNKIDKAKVEKVVEMARQDYDSLLNRVNEVLREQGMKEIPYRQGYFPHFTEPKQNFVQKLLNWKTQDNDIPTSIAGLTEDFKPVKSWQSFDKTRHSDETDYSFMKGFDNYSKGALDWVYHLEDIQKRRAVENYIRYTHSDEGIQARIKEVYADETLDADEAQAKIEHILAEAKNPLNNFVQDFMTHTNILAGKKNSLDRAVEQGTNRHIYSVMTNVQNRMSANMVLANIRSALTNFIPITQSWAQVSPLRSLQATKDTIANAIKDDGTINKSTFLTNRLRETDNLYKTGWDKVLDKAGIMFEIVDNFSSQVIWRSKYNDNLAKGMSESQAIKNADQFAENVMAGRSKGNEPTLFNAKNPLVKAFTMFQLEVNNQYGYLFKDAPNDLKAETNHWKLNLAKGYTTAFIGAYVYNALMEQVAGSGAALDPIGIIEDLLRDLGLFDDDEEKEADEVVTNLIENVGEELPFVGGTLFGGGRIPISSAVPYGDNGLVAGIGDFVGDVSEGNWGNVGKEMMNPLLNVGLPVGGGQIKKTMQGLSMFNTDEDHPIAGSYTDSGALRFPVEDTIGNRVQAGLFGQWANKNARDYIENGRKPLNEKQTQEFIDSEMPIADYWKYLDGLKGLKTHAEKADYIDGLDITDEQKNLLMNNVLDRKEDVDMSNYGDYGSFEEFDYAQKNPNKYAFSKATGGYESYLRYSDDLYDIKADKDAYGKTINGSRKAKVLDYINNLDADYETKIILYKKEYPSDDTYNNEIIEYINGLDDLTYEERIAIYEELGFTVKDGYVYW